MRRPDPLFSAQVGDSLRDFYCFKITPGRKRQFGDSLLQEGFRFLVQPAKFFDVGRRHFTVRVDSRSAQAFILETSCFYYSFPDNGARFAGTAVGQFFLINRGNVNMKIDSVEKRSGKPFLILKDRSGQTPACPFRMPEITARTQICR